MQKQVKLVISIQTRSLNWKKLTELREKIKNCEALNATLAYGITIQVLCFNYGLLFP